MMGRRLCSSLVALCFLGGWGGLSLLHGQAVPKLNTLSPEWVQRGTTNELVLEGENLGQVSGFILSGPGGLSAAILPPTPAPATVEVSRGGIELADETDRRLIARLSATMAAMLGAREIRAAAPGGVSNPLIVNVDYLPQLRETGANNTTNQAQKVELPVAISGVLRQPAEADYYRFCAQKGQRLIFDVQANRLGSALDSSLALFDLAGGELARSEDDHGLDSFLDFTAPVDGEYILELRDFRFQGGADYRYRLCAGPLPYLDHIFPFGGRRGQTVELALRGRNLDDLAKLKLFVESDAPPGVQEVRIHTARGFSNPVQFDVGDAPEFTETEPNNATNQANQVEVPVSVNGRIQGDEDVDGFKFKVEQGQVLVFEVWASRFGSPLDAVLSLVDANGNVLQRNDDAAGPDARIERRFDNAGEYRATVGDLLGRNGEDYGYRLTIRAPAPDFTARLLADTPRVHRGAFTPVRVEVERQAGFGGAIEITGQDLSAGLTCLPLVITPEFSGGTLMIAAAADAPLGTAPLELKASGVVAGRKLMRGVQPLSGDRPVKASFCTVLEAAPFSVEPLTLSASVEQEQSTVLEVVLHRRDGYAGEVQLALEGFSAGRDPISRSVETGPVTLKGYDTQGTLNLKARLDAELGTRPVWIRGEAKVNGQAVSVASRPLPLTIREFPFALANSLPRLSVTALPSGLKSAAGEAEFLVRVSRRGWFTDDINLAIEGLPEGITATATNLPRYASEAAFKLTAGEKAPAGKEVPLRVVGTAHVNGRRYEVRSPELKLTINPAPETNALAEAKAPAP
jgi:hypothetical protein